MKNTVICFRATEKMKEDVIEKAKDLGITASAYINLVLNEKINNKKL